MSDPIDRTGLAPRFWEHKKLSEMTRKEWEALCDGCGKCCLNKLEDEDTGEVALTRVACRLLDDNSCRCAHYAIRHHFVPECIVLTPKNIEKQPLLDAGNLRLQAALAGRAAARLAPADLGQSRDACTRPASSMRGVTVPEFEVDEDDWEDHIIEEPT